LTARGRFEISPSVFDRDNLTAQEEKNEENINVGGGCDRRALHCNIGFIPRAGLQDNQKDD